jgi:GNAT superfamily N-acetyltransferase
MIVREATEADVPAIAALLADDGLGRGREAPGDPAYGRAFAAMSAQPGNVYLVAEEDGEPIGCLQFTLIHGLSRLGAARAQIEGVRVRADRRGRGVGEALFEAAFARARDLGCALVQLTTDRRRADALRFYERLGFAASHWGMKREIQGMSGLICTDS